jgi:hypothetical protein
MRSCSGRETVALTSAMPEPRLYAFSTHIGTACAKQMRTYADLAEKLNLTGPDQRLGP